MMQEIVYHEIRINNSFNFFDGLAYAGLFISQ